jgi:hypothetical protein
MPWGQWWFVPVILVSSLIIGTFAGLYPAFYLSGFRPVQVLKGPISGGSKSPLLRNSLVVFQFTASIILIISTIVIYDQTHFILNHKVGFDKDQVMLLQGTNTFRGWQDQNVQRRTIKNSFGKKRVDKRLFTDKRHQHVMEIPSSKKGAKSSTRGSGPDLADRRYLPENIGH